MQYLIGAVIWPLLFVGLYFVHPVLFPNDPPLATALLFFAALLGMVTCAFAGDYGFQGFCVTIKQTRKIPPRCSQRPAPLRHITLTMAQQLCRFQLQRDRII